MSTRANTESKDLIKEFLLESIKYHQEMKELSRGVNIDQFVEERVKDFNYVLNIINEEEDFLTGLPENTPLYKDSGLWQLRSDDMEEVLITQGVNESDKEFIYRCKNYNQ